MVTLEAMHTVFSWLPIYLIGIAYFGGNIYLMVKKTWDYPAYVNAGEFITELSITFLAGLVIVFFEWRSNRKLRKERASTTRRERQQHRA